MNQEKYDQNKTRKKEWTVEIKVVLPQLHKSNLFLFLNCRRSGMKKKKGEKI